MRKMKIIKGLFKNLIFVISSAAYIVLAVPAEPKWLLCGVALVVLTYIITRFLTNISEFVKGNRRKVRLVIAILLSLLLGFRFEKAWRYSSQMAIVSSELGISISILLYILGIILGLVGIYFCLSMLTLFIELPKKLFRETGVPEKYIPKRKLNKGLLFGILVVLVLQASALTYWGVQKEGFHVDEVYTYELSNYQYTNYGDAEGTYDTWISGAQLKTVAEPDGTELFNLTIPYWNSETDNHPLEYYTVIHVFSSIFKILNIEEVKWIGLIPNFLACLLTTIILILLGYRLTQKNIPAIMFGAFWALSIGAINTGVYIRMYAFLTFWCVLFVYLHLLFYQKMNSKMLDLRFISTMVICTAAGVLSQYYFLIFAFLTCAITFFTLAIKKHWKLLISYCTMEFCGVFLAELMFPRMLVRLFFGDRGAEALSNAANADLVTKLKEILVVINNEIFAGYGQAIIGIVVIIIFMGVLVSLYRKNSFTIEDKFIGQMAIVVVLFIIVITKLAPYMSDRYFMCSFPILLTCCAYFVYRGIRLIIASDQIGYSISTAILIIVVAAITFIGYQAQDVNYIYGDQVERRAAIENYGDIPVVTLNADFYDDSILKWLFELQNYSDVFMCHYKNFQNLADADVDRKLDNGFLLYCHMYSEEDGIISEVEKYLDFIDYELVTEIGECPVYYFH